MKRTDFHGEVSYTVRRVVSWPVVRRIARQADKAITKTEVKLLDAVKVIAAVQLPADADQQAVRDVARQIVDENPDGYLSDVERIDIPKL